MSEVEKIVAYNNIRHFLNKQAQLDLLEKLELEADNIENRIIGLKKEHEFILLLDFFLSCKHILAFDEGVSRLTDSYQPDLLIELKNGEKIFIEIKTTKNLKYSISGGNLSKKIDFSNNFGFPLYFAVKLKSGWGLYSSDKVLNNSGKLNFNEDMISSEFAKKFGCYSYLFPEGTTILCEYTKSGNGLGFHHPNHGELIKFQVIFQGNSVLIVDESSPEFWVFFIFLKLLINNSRIYGDETEENRETTVLVSHSIKVNAILIEYNVFLEFINGIKKDNNDFYDSTTLLKSKISGEFKLLPSVIPLRHMISVLTENGLPILIGL